MLRAIALTAAIVAASPAIAQAECLDEVLASAHASNLPSTATILRGDGVTTIEKRIPGRAYHTVMTSPEGAVISEEIKVGERYWRRAVNDGGQWVDLTADAQRNDPQSLGNEAFDDAQVLESGIAFDCRGVVQYQGTPYHLVRFEPPAPFKIMTEVYSDPETLQVVHVVTRTDRDVPQLESEESVVYGPVIIEPPSELS